MEKIAFSLEVDHGYPPISVEWVNAEALDEDRFVIRNSPFFVEELAYGDVVTVTCSADGVLEFESCVEQSSFKALSIIILNERMDRELMDFFRGLQCVIEYGEFGKKRMLAVGVPDTVDYTKVKQALDGYETSGLISYAELVA